MVSVDVEYRCGCRFWSWGYCRDEKLDVGDINTKPQQIYLTKL